MDWIDEPVEEQDQPAVYLHNVSKDTPKYHKPCDHKLDTLNQYKAWKEIVLSLMEPFLPYIGSTTADVAPQAVDIPQCLHCNGSKMLHYKLLQTKSSHDLYGFISYEVF